MHQEAEGRLEVGGLPGSEEGGGLQEAEEGEASTSETSTEGGEEDLLGGGERKEGSVEVTLKGLEGEIEDKWVEVEEGIRWVEEVNSEAEELRIEAEGVLWEDEEEGVTFPQLRVTTEVGEVPEEVLEEGGEGLEVSAEGLVSSKMALDLNVEGGAGSETSTRFLSRERRDLGSSLRPAGPRNMILLYPPRSSVCVQRLDVVFAVLSSTGPPYQNLTTTVRRMRRA